MKVSPCHVRETMHMLIRFSGYNSNLLGMLEGKTPSTFHVEYLPIHNLQYPHEYLCTCTEREQAGIEEVPCTHYKAKQTFTTPSAA